MENCHDFDLIRKTVEVGLDKVVRARLYSGDQGCVSLQILKLSLYRVRLLLDVDWGQFYVDNRLVVVKPALCPVNVGNERLQMSL